LIKHFYDVQIFATFITTNNHLITTKMSDENKDLGDKAEDAFDKAKESAKEFSEDVKKTFDTNNPDSGKTVAIIAHITLIGWIVAIIINSSNKTDLGSYYIRQTLGIWLLALVLSWIPIVGCFAFLICVVLIVMSVINAVNEKKVPTPIVGEYFQDWFKSL
jgi:hypothetical protein